MNINMFSIQISTVGTSFWAGDSDLISYEELNIWPLAM